MGGQGSNSAIRTGVAWIVLRHQEGLQVAGGDASRRLAAPRALARVQQRELAPVLRPQRPLQYDRDPGGSACWLHNAAPAKLYYASFDTCPPHLLDRRPRAQDLLPELQQYWPSLVSPIQEDFWNHEWTRHGTCCEHLTPKV